ncbi:hypothetical protein GQ53DRAFT_847654 [Thozetella sp. PMI_491]|nr:hypothetical protein GQ53DRAFT_847654 [Thozetella sp. PMI_491]
MSPNHPQMDDSDVVRPAKRRKIGLACQECRDKKTRCDGGRPVCNACLRKKLGPEQCIYIVNGQSNPDNSYVKSLESRIRELERTRYNDAEPVNAESSTSIQQHGDSPLAVDVASTQDHPHPFHRDELHTPTAALLIPGLPSNGNLTAVFQPPSPQAHHSPTLGHTGHTHGLRSRIPRRDEVAQAERRAISMTPSITTIITPAAEGICSPSLPHSQEPSLGHTAAGLITPTTQLAVGVPPENMYGRRSRVGARSLDGDNIDTGHAKGISDEAPIEPYRAVYMGPSSAVGFMEGVRQSSGATAGHSGRDEDLPRLAAPSTFKRGTKKDRQELVALLNELILPPRRIADLYFARYWEMAHLYFPALHKPTFEKRYENIWNQAADNATENVPLDGSVHTTRAFYATLNIIFALGCIFPSQDEESPYREGAHVFIDRSQALLKDMDPEYGSIQLVQALVLTTQYLQTSGMVNECWVTVGTAIRVAQGIGIHLDVASESQAGREERKRTWWCCLLLDRVLSMNSGRPPMVTWPTTVSIPEPVDDALLSVTPGSSAQPLRKQQKSEFAFFSETLKLSNIIMLVLKTLYRPLNEVELGGLAKNETLTRLIRIIEINAELTRWRQEIPGYLVHDNEESLMRDDSPFRSQATMLHCRSLYLKILLFRPMMLKLSNPSFFQLDPVGKEDEFQRSMFTGCVRSCVLAAQELVDIICSPLYATVIPPWWYSTFYLYISGMVMLCVLLSSNLRQVYGNNLSEIENTLAQCMEGLLKYDERGYSVARPRRRVLQAIRSQKLRPQPSHHVSEGEPIDFQTEGAYGFGAGGQGYRKDSSGQATTGEDDLPEFLWTAGGYDWFSNLYGETSEMEGTGEYAALT